MNTIHALEEARQLLLHHWTKGAFARDIRGAPVGILSSRACNFDLLGAIAFVSNNNPMLYAEMFECLSECIDESLSDWNDSASQDEVVGYLSDVIGTFRSRNNHFAGEPYDED